MKLEKQLTPLPQARRLDELGVKGESYYVWVEGGKLSDPVKRAEIHPKEVMDNRVCLADAAYRLFPAYSVPELMDALPEELDGAYLCVHKSIVCYRKPIYSEMATYYEELYIQRNTNLAEALSDMLIRLIENDLLPIPEK